MIKKLFYSFLLLFGALSQAEPLTMNFINTGPPGGSADVFMDAYIPCLNKADISVVKIFKPGADGFIAVQYILNSTDTTDTINVVTGGVGMLQTNKFPNGVDTQQSLTPVIYTGKMETVLLSKTGPGAINSIEELVALSKTRPVNVGVAGGLLPFISREWLDNMGVKYTVIPYKSTTQGQIDLIGGDLDLTFSMFVDSSSLVKAGRLQILTSSMSPVIAAKYAHKNIDNYVNKNKQTTLLPTGSLLTVKKGANPKHVEQLRAAVASCSKQPDIIAKLASLDADMITLSPEEIAKSIAAFRKSHP